MKNPKTKPENNDELVKTIDSLGRLLGVQCLTKDEYGQQMLESVWSKEEKEKIKSKILELL